MNNNNNIANKKEDVNAKGPDSSQAGIIADEEDSGAVQHLIYHSFYPLTCMVPLGEDFISISENVPDFMQPKSNDSLLQETIKTFHSLMQEKDDEILNLRRQLNNEDSTLAKVMSEAIQTDLTLDACEDMERKLDEMSKTLPEKVEEIYQLTLEKSTLEKTIEELKMEDDKSKVSQLEEELSESLKNLVELEEGNLALSKENKDLKQSHLELKWQLEEVNDLKLEVELAKIQTEEEVVKLKASLNEVDTKVPTASVIPLDEIERMRLEYQKQISELEKQLAQSHKTMGKATLPEKSFELSELIDKVKINILHEKSNSKVLSSVTEVIPNYSERLGPTDLDLIDELVNISLDTTTSESDIRTIINVLDSMQITETGDIDKNAFDENFHKRRNDKTIIQELNNQSKIDLQQRALSSGLMLKMNIILLTMDIRDLREEYTKLEVILNLLNRSYKVTHLAVLNKMPYNDLVNGILSMRGTIYEICMHKFWENIFHQTIEDKDKTHAFSMTSVDRHVFSDLLFSSFTNKEMFKTYLAASFDIREILLVGEATKTVVNANNIELMKIRGINICHDVSNHLLPMFPKEIRYLLMGKTIEDGISTENNLINNISTDFFNTFVESNGQNDTELLMVIFEILSILDFESEIFSTSSKAPTSDYKMAKLSISSISNKIENSVVKVGVNKNVKDYLLRKLDEIQNILNVIKENVIPQSYKRKLENELLKDLIDKKEAVLRFIFKDSFRPTIEKLSLNKGSVYLSCVSKEKVGLDFWIKNLMEKYYLKQLNHLKELSVDEMVICITRLAKALQIMCPSFVAPDLEPKKTKIALTSAIIKYRKMLKSYIDSTFIGKTSKLKSIQNLDGIMNQDQFSSKTTLNKLKEIFNNNVSQNEKLEDVLQRLYDIDCEIFPGVFDQDFEKRNFSTISDNELLEEILKLRLSIAAYVILPFEGTHTIGRDPTNQRNEFKTLKEIETIIMKIEPGIVDESIIVSEIKFLKAIIDKLRKRKKIDDEKLRNCFLAFKKVECGIYNTSFDAIKLSAEFDKRIDNSERKLFVLNEAENLISVLGSNIVSKRGGKELCEGYIQIEELLKEIEAKMSPSDQNVKKSWTFTVWEKTNVIIKLISQKETDEGFLWENVLNNLDNITIWVSQSSDWRRDTFNRLNNLIRKVNSRSNNRKIHISTADNFEMSGDFQDEKQAFEKAFSQLEDQFNSLTSINKKDKSKVDDFELDQKTDDELRNIILALEREISPDKWTRTDENEAEEWLRSRNREELVDDCNNLVHKSVIKKIENLINNGNENPTSMNRLGKEAQIAQFEEDINAKLAKYEELCETVEKLKIPQTQVPRRTESSNQLFQSGTYDKRRHEITSSLEPQFNNRLSSSPIMRPSSSQMYLSQNSNDEIDSYFQQRLDELQKLVRPQNNSMLRDKDWSSSRNIHHNGTDIVVDGFDLEDERTPRYYSMKLQDIQHERKEDEMGALIHHMEKHRSNLLIENENLQQQLHVNKSLQENQNIRIVTLEKTEDMLRRKLTESGDVTDSQNSVSLEELQIMRHEKQRLTNTLTSTQKRMDLLNSELVSVASSNSNLQHENHNLIIKNQYLERSIKKIEELYEDLVQQLAYCKTQSIRNLPEKTLNDFERRDSPISDTNVDQKLKMTENEKKDLVIKLDIIDKQNKLLRKHCEKMTGEVSELTRKLAESLDKSETYLRQNQQLTDILDKMKVNGKSRSDSPSLSISLHNKDDEIKQLRNKILHLETKLLSINESPSAERLKHELVTNKDKEIARLTDQIGSLQDHVDETKAQLEVKEYENRKLQAMTRQLQNKINDDSYFPPPGYKIVKDH